MIPPIVRNEYDIKDTNTMKNKTWQIIMKAIIAVASAILGAMGATAAHAVL